MNEIEIFNHQGVKIEKIKLTKISEKDKSGEEKIKNISLAHFQYRTNLKQNTKKVKNRSEVSASTRKIVRQKGTGGARHGSLTAPQFRGGGVAFGPRGEKPEKLKINKKFKRIVLYQILNSKSENEEIAIIDEIKMDNWKTKEANLIIFSIISKMIENKKKIFEIKEKELIKKKILMIVSKKDNNLEKIKMIFRNIKNLRILESNIVNPYYLISNRWIILTKKAFEEINERINNN